MGPEQGGFNPEDEKMFTQKDADEVGRRIENQEFTTGDFHQVAINKQASKRSPDSVPFQEHQKRVKETMDDLEAGNPQIGKPEAERYLQGIEALKNEKPQK